MNNYMSKNELAESLGVSLATINRKMKEIPHMKMGDNRKHRVLFDTEKVKEYLKKFEVNPSMDKKITTQAGQVGSFKMTKAEMRTLHNRTLDLKYSGIENAINAYQENKDVDHMYVYGPTSHNYDEGKLHCTLVMKRKYRGKPYTYRITLDEITEEEIDNTNG